MGIFSKVFKGIKKVAKKIGKGIKKIGKKLLGAIGKIGPIGQLALMFIGIPPVISNFFGSIGGAITGVLGKAGTVVSNFATKIAPNLTKGLGKAFNAIKTAGQGAYNSVTEAIGKGVDGAKNFLDRTGNFAKGEGFTLSEGKTSIFAPKADVDITKITDTVVDTGEISAQYTPTTTEDRLSAALKDTPSKDLLGKDVVNIDKTFGERTKDYFTGQIEDFTDTFKNPGQALGESVKQGALGGISQSIAMDVAGPPPTQKVMHSSLSDFMTPTTQRQLDAATWNNINTSYQKAGSSFGAAGDAMTPYFTELANFDNDINYQRQMAMLNPTFNPIR